MIITVARKCGCYGDTLGQELAKRYGIPFYDKERISELAKEKDIYDKYPDYYGEIPVNTLLYTISVTEEDDVLYDKPKKALASLIDGQDCVVLGRCVIMHSKTEKIRYQYSLRGMMIKELRI